MSYSFTKLFSSITDSTVWGESSDVRIVWITLLAMADRDGMIHASVPGLAYEARVSVSVTREALRIFMEPDPDSRTKDHEGRRIAEIDGGWILLNHAKYRALRDADERRAYKAKKERERRERIKKTANCNETKDSRGQNRGQRGQKWTDVDIIAEADTDTDLKKAPTGPKKETPPPPRAAAPEPCEPPQGSSVSLDPEKNPTTHHLATLAALATPWFRAKPHVTANTVTATHRRGVYDAARREIENFLAANPEAPHPSLPEALEILRRQFEQHERTSPKEFASYRSKKFEFYFTDMPWHNVPETAKVVPFTKTERMMQSMNEARQDPDYYRKTYGVQ